MKVDLIFIKPERGIQSYKVLQKQNQKTKHYKTSDWINKEIKGGVTPFNSWELSVLWACWANSCATWLKSLPMCWKVQDSKELRICRISWIRWPELLLVDLSFMAWIAASASDSIMTWEMQFLGKQNTLKQGHNLHQFCRIACF